jgi:sterol desaturase/sphingolipid hydroxylase (fatty acid hydroxylase superfamily)
MITYFIALILGILFWTFLEYVIHRFLLHKKGASNPATDEHLRHHRQGNYFAPFWKKLLASLSALVIFSLIVCLAVDFVHGILFSAGIAGMYLIYEITHMRLHARAPLISYGMIIRKHHFYHHFGNPKKNHGVTVRFWDRVFGTFEHTLTDTVNVPRKMVLPWLVDDAGLPVERYQRHFLIR